VDPKPKLTTDQQVAHYRILKLLGEGGMGEVYLAEDTRLGRNVALKFLARDFTVDDERVRRFAQEARSASALNHPNILTIHEIADVDGHRFIATEFVNGQTLRQLMTLGPLAELEALNIAEQIAYALSAAHAAGIVHRDIKPENIMLRDDGIVKVLDFGLAKLALKEETSPEDATRQLVKTSEGVVMGTAAYMSPEQARGQAVDARSDIFSLGAVTYEMLTGQRPFAGETTSDVLAAVLKTEPPLLSHSAPQTSKELQRIVSKTMRKDREERYQVIKDLWLDLKTLHQDLDFEAKLELSAAPHAATSGAATTTASGEVPATGAAAATQTATLSGAETSGPRNQIRRRPIVLVATLLVLTALVFGVVRYWRSGTSEVAIDSIAVLPFTNQSGDPNTDYLSDGLTESAMKKDSAQKHFFTDAQAAEDRPKANLSSTTSAYLNALDIEPETDVETAALVWTHALAIGNAPLYLAENTDGIRADWPRIPLPMTKNALPYSAELGRRIAALLDTEQGVNGVTTGAIAAPLKSIAIISTASGGALNPNEDLKVTAGWGFRQKSSVMPGKGNVIERDYSPDERKAIEHGAQLLGVTDEAVLAHLGERTCDVYLNDVAYWKNIPARVWDYTIGGYQVIKKWLSYRELELLDRPLTPDEAREVMNMARRIAAIVLLEPALDANYQAVKSSTYSWPDSGPLT
jgi:serine/threonine protein kinase